MKKVEKAKASPSRGQRHLCNVLQGAPELGASCNACVIIMKRRLMVLSSVTSVSPSPWMGKLREEDTTIKKSY